MHARTQATLHMLDEVTWCRSVGQPISEKVLVLSSWDDALESCASNSWEAIQLEAMNIYRAKATRTAKERFAGWNDSVRDIKQVTHPMVQRHLEPVLAQLQLIVANKALLGVFSGCVRWDILHLAMEAEYADAVPLGFYTGLSYWYYEGHFPCGWLGNPPDGKLIIYSQ